MLFKGVVIALASALCFSLWDIAAIFPFLESNRTFIVSNIIYIAFFSFVFSVIEELYISSSAIYEIYFSPDKDKRDDNETPTIIFHNEVASFYLDLSLEGKEKTFNNRKIEIHFPSWVTIQPELSKKYLVNVSNDVCYIDISKLFHKKSKERNNAGSKIQISLLLKEQVSGQTKTISTQVTGGNVFSRKFFTRIKRNKMKIKIS